MAARRSSADCVFSTGSRVCTTNRPSTRTGTALEINAAPERMDLPPQDISAAREAGVKFAIDTDAHSIVHLTPDDVINAWPLEQLEQFLRRGRSS